MKERSEVLIWRYIESRRTSDIFHVRASNIAKATGVSIRRIQAVMKLWRDDGAIERTGFGGHEIHFKPTLPSSPALDSDVTRLSEFGLSLNQIASQLGTSRGAVAGKRDRLALPKRNIPEQFRKQVNNQH